MTFHVFLKRLDLHLIFPFSYNEKVSSMYFLSGKSYRGHILIPVFEGINENSYKHVFKSLNSLCCQQFAKVLRKKISRYNILQLVYRIICETCFLKLSLKEIMSQRWHCLLKIIFTRLRVCSRFYEISGSDDVLTNLHRWPQQKLEDFDWICISA